MLKVVFDTNVIVSALLVEEGLPALLLDLAMSKKIQLFYSPALMTEYEQVLCREKFRLPREKVRKTLEEIRRSSTEVCPRYTLTVITRDPADNRILEAGQSAKADYIITGNRRHFPFEMFGKTRVAPPREFVASEGATLTERT